MTCFAWDEMRFYSVKEVAGFMGFGCDWVRRMFRKEAGVLVAGSARYCILRIPGRVITRVANRMSAGGGH